MAQGTKEGLTELVVWGLAERKKDCAEAEVGRLCCVIIAGRN